MKKYKDKEWLSSKINDGFSSFDLAGECGVSPSAIDYWKRKYGIGKDKYTEDLPINNPEWLVEKYHKEGMSLSEIAELDVCDISEQALYHRLDYFDIEKRNSNASYKTLALSQGVPEESNHLNDKWLYRKYVNEEMTISEIAALESVKASKSSVKRALRAFGIERRPEGFQEGEKHPRFNPDYDADYGPHWRNIRQHIRERDNFCCQNCGVTQNEYIQAYNRKLDVHHITPLSEFSDIEEANKDSNLITLCLPCHRKAEYGNIDCPKP